MLSEVFKSTRICQNALSFYKTNKQISKNLPVWNDCSSLQENTFFKMLIYLRSKTETTVYVPISGTRYFHFNKKLKISILFLLAMSQVFQDLLDTHCIYFYR